TRFSRDWSSDVCSSDLPPLRSEETAKRLRERIFANEIHTIGSDHNCFSLQQKLSTSGDVRQMPNGLPGVETRIPVAYSELVNHRSEERRVGKEGEVG